MKQKDTIRSKRETLTIGPRSSISWRHVLLTLVCAAIMAAGFFFAALQHFATMDLGFKNSKLRNEVAELEAEKRRLLLARETTLSPASLDRAARSFGFTEIRASDTVQIAAVREKADAATRTLDVKEKSQESRERSVSSLVAAVSVAPKSVQQGESKTVKTVISEPTLSSTGLSGRPRRVAARETAETSSTAAFTRFK